MANPNQASVAVVGSYIPRRCGIATFTHDLATAIANHAYHDPLGGGEAVTIVAMNDQEDGYDYGDEVRFQINQHRREDYRNAAETLNDSKINVVSLQHEYGIYGGEEGEYILDFIDRLNKPLIPTLHTVLRDPLPKQLEVLRQICARSQAVAVMAERAKSILNQRYDVPLDRIKLIHHGVPDVPFGDTEPFKARFGLSGRPTILTFGLLNQFKSIETMVDAVGKVAPEFPDVAYIILGVTHPAVVRESGEEYRLSLEQRAVELGIQRNVLFHNRYVSMEDLREYLQAADLYATPYACKEQITSGTLAYAVATGRAVISTPYWHAQELLADGRGRLADFGDVDGFAHHLRDLLRNRDLREKIRRTAYDFGREMVWPRVAQRYKEAFADARSAFDKTTREPAEQRILRTASLPAREVTPGVPITEAPLAKTAG